MSWHRKGLKQDCGWEKTKEYSSHLSSHVLCPGFPSCFHLGGEWVAFCFALHCSWGAEFRFFRMQLSTKFESLFLMNTRKERRMLSHPTTRFRDGERLIVVSKTKDIKASTIPPCQPPTSPQSVKCSPTQQPNKPQVMKRTSEIMGQKVHREGRYRSGSLRTVAPLLCCSLGSSSLPGSVFSWSCSGEAKMAANSTGTTWVCRNPSEL